MPAVFKCTRCQVHTRYTTDYCTAVLLLGLLGVWVLRVLACCVGVTIDGIYFTTTTTAVGVSI